MLTKDEYTDYCKAVRKSTNNLNMRNYLYDYPKWSLDTMRIIIEVAHMVMKTRTENRGTDQLMRLVIELLEVEGQRINQCEIFCQQIIKS